MPLPTNIFKRNTDNNDASIHVDIIPASRGVHHGKIMLLALLCMPFLTTLAASSENRIAVAVNGDSNDCTKVGGKCHGGYVYCLGKNCPSLPAGKTGGVIAPTDLITSDTTGWQADTNHDGLVWGGYKSEVGVGAQNKNNGLNNTGAIYTALTA